MSKDTTYNGWPNYETWAVKLWMDNEEASYLHWQAVARETWAETPEEPEEFCYGTRRDRTRYALAARLKEESEEANPMVEEASIWSDLMSHALGRVDWDRIADHLIDDEVPEAAQTASEEAGR